MGGLGACPHPKLNLNLDPLRLLLMQSGIKLLFNTCDKTILNFKIPARLSTITGLDWWTGLVDWTGGLISTKNHFYAPNETYSPVGLQKHPSSCTGLI